MAAFKAAVARASEPDFPKLPNATRENMTQVYGLFKQSRGDCNKPKPGMMDPVGRAKWDAWDSLKGMSQAEAMAAYVTIIAKID
eukprot:CAMPEP_0182577668 /NCGR_PEP_ID=MMETSP1324-20130603/38514_1 /TAXON_ID=236786 /ORGANISM="Florenciella sp., Strain RCC1587" /LENGTH=83 /DNA_ID=CAMNT_0024793523 /DNA_START=60 /DNA_END=308 /DNA_ORIENTATION=-